MNSKRVVVTASLDCLLKHQRSGLKLDILVFPVRCDLICNQCNSSKTRAPVIVIILILRKRKALVVKSFGDSVGSSSELTKLSHHFWI